MAEITGERRGEQVKRVESVAVDGLRSFMSLLGDDDVGLFCLHRRLDLKMPPNLARRQEKRKITLLDLEQF
jgi:restriction system protein